MTWRGDIYIRVAVVGVVAVMGCSAGAQGRPYPRPPYLPRTTNPTPQMAGSPAALVASWYATGFAVFATIAAGCALITRAALFARMEPRS